MANINDLKKNAKPVTPANDNVVIDYTSNSKLDESIKHNEEVYNNRPKGKTIVNQEQNVKGPDGRIYVNTPKKPANTEGRVAFDLTQLPEEKHDEDIHTSITQDILSGENPILYDYIKEKQEEMEQWVEAKEDEKKLKEAEQEEGIEIDLTAAPTDIDTSSTETKEADPMSFDDFETTTNTTNEEYVMVDDIGLDDNTTITSEVEDTEVEEVEEPISEDEELVDTLDEEEKIEDHVDEVNLETPKVSEVKAAPEVKLVDSDGIAFQETKSIEYNVPIEDEEVKEDDENEIDEGTKHIIELASKVIKPVAKKLDLSSYTVVKKPAANTKLLNQKQINVAKWVLRKKKVCVHMKASQGAELEELRSLMQDAEVASDFIRLYRIVYDHIVSPKPNSFEAWCKSTYAEDLDDYFFAFFIANYKGSNYLPYDCPNKDCKPGTFLSDNLPIMDMVKFGSDKDKEKFSDIYKSEVFDINENGLYVTERIPFSNEIAIAFKETTLYSFIETQSIRNNESFLKKYAATIAMAPYIDDIFIIDHEHQTLCPIDYKKYPDSNANTYKSKIQKYDSVLKSLTADEFATLTSFIGTFSTETKDIINIKYVRPAAKCPDCGAEIKEEETSAQSLVFFRYQLGQMVNISTK